MMPTRGSCPLGIVHRFPAGLARPQQRGYRTALHNANLGDRPPGCPLSARPKFNGHAVCHFLATVAFSIVTAVLGAPSLAPPSTPPFATSSTTFRPAVSIFPKGVNCGGSLVSL